MFVRTHGHEFIVVNVLICSLERVVGVRCGGIQLDPTLVVQQTCC
jgi:hypothetical protein